MPADVDHVTTGERLHSFDAIRATALLLGVVLHAGESFIPDNRAWAIVDDSTSSLASVMVYVIHIFRMPVFFLLAGFFGRMALQRRGPADFIRDRAKRILVPFVLGWCLLYPLIVCAWIWGAQRSGGGFLRGGAAREPAWQVTFVAFATGDVFRDGVKLAHLWFLYFLLTYYAAVLTVRQGLVVPLDRAMGLRARSDRALAAVWRTRWYFVLLALPVFGSLCLAPGWVGVDTPEPTLRPNPPYLLAYATFFAVGWLLHRQPHLVDALARKYRSCLGWAILLTLLAIIILGQAREPSDVWVRIPYVAAYALAMWMWVLGLVGLGVRYVSRSQPAVRYLSESSYWLYLTHLPLVLFLQVSVARLPWPWSLKLALVLVVAMSLLLASYHSFVRFTAVGLVLNGQRRERAGRTARAEALAAGS